MGTPFSLDLSSQLRNNKAGMRMGRVENSQDLFTLRLSYHQWLDVRQGSCSNLLTPEWRLQLSPTGMDRGRGKNYGQGVGITKSLSPSWTLFLSQSSRLPSHQSLPDQRGPLGDKLGPGAGSVAEGREAD